MSAWDYLQDARASIALLRRLDAGDESAYKEIEPLLKLIDDRDAKHRAEYAAKQERREKRSAIGRKNSGQFQIAPSCENGVDHSASGIVLLQHTDGHRLVWRSGGCYTSGQSRNYAPAELEIIRPYDDHNRVPMHLTNNFNNPRSNESRLSTALIMKYREKIDAVFGEGAAERASKLKSTIVIGKIKL